MAIEQSVYLIKPEGRGLAVEIKEMVARSGLVIVAAKTVVLTEDILQQMYPNLSGWLWQMTLCHLLNYPCEMVLVEGEGAVQKLLELAGVNVNPRCCKLGTIRRFCYDLQSVPMFIYPGPREQEIYYFNFLHRPKNQEAAQREVAIFERG